MSSKPLFNRGYKEVTKKIGKGSKYTMSCFSCDHFYKAPGDSEEVCQNPNVLKYDMVITESSIYCNHWKLSVNKEDFEVSKEEEEEVNKLFRSTMRKEINKARGFTLSG